jgi:hypothetical protein
MCHAEAIIIELIEIILKHIFYFSKNVLLGVEYFKTFKGRHQRVVITKLLQTLTP